jgi:hypothetical protein
MTPRRREVRPFPITPFGGQISFPILLPDGSQRFLRELAELETNPAGEPLRVRGVIQNITEIRNIEEQLQTAQRLDWIGRMTTEIAHEFGDFLTVFRGMAPGLCEGLRMKARCERRRKPFSAPVKALLCSSGNFSASVNRQQRSPRHAI